MRAFLFTLVFILPLSTVTGYYIGGIFQLLTLFIVFLLIPIADHILGITVRNPAPADEPGLIEQQLYRWLTWAVVPAQVALLVWAFGLVAGGDVAPLPFVALILSTGVVTGAMGLTAAHELIHRQTQWERALGKLLLATVWYLHWAVEHVSGHHRHVATPQDPATAWLGESYYAFWPRSVFGGWFSAWDLEQQRLARLGLGPIRWANQVIQGFVLQAALTVAIWITFGFWTMMFFVLQSAVAFSLLELVNYIEHYGLERQLTEDGKYEKVSSVHSWNDSHLLTNLFLFNLQRHSDHHARPHIRYQALRHYDESPQLPAGYAAMIPAALLPPLWRRIMDWRVTAHQVVPATTLPQSQ